MHTVEDKDIDWLGKFDTCQHAKDKKEYSIRRQKYLKFGMREMPSVSTKIFKQLLDVFDTCNTTYKRELDQFHLTQELTSIPGRIPAHQFYNFVGSVVKNSHNYDFGFAGKLHCTPEQLLDLGISCNTPDLKSLMQSFGRSYANQTDLVRISIWKDVEGAFWFGMILHPSISSHIRWPYLGVHLSMLIQIVRYAEGQDWLPKQIILPEEASQLLHKPHWLDKCPMHTSDFATAVRVDATSMQKLPDGFLKSVQQNTIQETTDWEPIYYTQESEVTNAVESVLHTFIRATKSAPSYYLMAEMNGISDRTLSRKLQAEGHSYRSLLRNVRIDLSKEYLMDLNDKVETVANRLGYPRSSSFVRSFQQATGMSPTQYRKNELSHIPEICK